MAAYGTSQEAMASGAAKVDAATTRVRAHLANLRSELDTMTGGWRNDTDGPRAGVQRIFDTQAAKIDGALRQMREALLETHQTYDHG